MPALRLPRPELFDQRQVAEILTIASERSGLPHRFHRVAIGYLAPAFGIAWRRDPTRPAAKTLDRHDIERIARFFGFAIDWDEVEAA